MTTRARPTSQHSLKFRTGHNTFVYSYTYMLRTSYRIQRLITRSIMSSPLSSPSTPKKPQPLAEETEPKPPTSTLKRPAPVHTESSSSSIQILSPTKKPLPASTEPPASGEKKETKTPQKDSQPVAKKQKVALLAPGTGGQTKLAFGSVGGLAAGSGNKKASTTPSTSTSTNTDSGKKAQVGTGSDSGSKLTTSKSSSAPSFRYHPNLFSPPAPTFLLPSSSSSALRQNLLLPLPVLSTHPTPAQIQDLLKLKEDYVSALSDDQKAYLEMEIDGMGGDWFVALRGEFAKGYFGDLKKFVIAEQNKYKVFPPAQDVYSWTRFCPLAGIRVVIIGQDPYHNDNQAHGLAFSVRKGVQVPPSLRNMYKELENEYDDFKAPKHGDLSSWAKQGVLLLNTSLTVRAHEANSHSKKGWETFTEKALKVVIDRLAKGAATEVDGPEGQAGQGAKGVVFLAWGAGAGKLVKGISERQHHVLTSAHPSPLSAARGFMGNGHFRKCNDWLEERYGKGAGIDWSSVTRE